jgi:hypothetical protein
MLRSDDLPLAIALGANLPYADAGSATNPADGASVVDRCGERLGCGSTAVQLVAVIRHHPDRWSAGSAALLERCGGRAWARCDSIE